jgi:hypothetical protein
MREVREMSIHGSNLPADDRYRIRESLQRSTGWSIRPGVSSSAPGDAGYKPGRSLTVWTGLIPYS